ncbi:alpha-hydroxy-acid oxidizing enzyme [Deinococcus malanensis]|uniref:Alpha-hydroxy-acid oxidizing enzyme n=1 Tax=Deinococcus malanensis TaxID=1706855 RepID=A0ABQ2ER22_9DEIO|nr:alpha-hydroxy acid oxidase [Deinococcus malanensis]GGK16604.1 alpha-hydroxy-acid oxidizing enzyme [Deinococcus malanensis]
MTAPHLPDLLNLTDMETAARQVMPPDALNYYASGANDEHTLRANRASFSHIRLRPRVLVDVSNIDLSTEVLGLPLSFPVGIAPCAMHGLVHPEAEVATACAAAAAGSLATLSTMSHKPIEAVAQAADGRMWFQLYLYRDREVSRALVQRAEAAGARALVLTVDTPFLGRREVMLRSPLHLPEGMSLPNVGQRQPGTEHLDDLSYLNTLFDPSMNWRDLEWLRSVTRLPIVLKGIHTAEDAALTVEVGGHVWISNHGGRQLDTAVTPLEALPEIVDTVQGRAEIYLDGGITRGTDVLKAVALGARAVFLGRAPLYGLAVAGEAGVRHTLELLREELQLAMALCGKVRLADLGPEVLRPTS